MAGSFDRGYIKIFLYSPGKARQVQLHTLILEVFCCARPIGQQARHGRNGKADNGIRNLKWGSSGANTRDCIESGGYWKSGASDHYLDLTPEAVFDTLDGVLSQRQLAKRHSASQRSIGVIQRGEHAYFTRRWALEQLAARDETPALRKAA